MQLKTAITLLELLAVKMRQAIEDYENNFNAVTLWSDASPMDDAYLEARAGCLRPQREVNKEILPAIDDLMKSTGGFGSTSGDYGRRFAILDALIRKWRKRTEGVTIEPPEGDHADQT